MQRLILDEITAIVSENITIEEARQFGAKVLDRYCNPHIEFDWLSICVQDTSKIKIRAVPIAVQHHKKYGFVPNGISLGFAAYILFMKSEFLNGKYIGRINGREYTIADDFAENLFLKWNSMTGAELVNAVLGDEILWDIDLSGLQGFSESVHFYLENLSSAGFFKTVELAFQVTPVLSKTY